MLPLDFVPTQGARPPMLGGRYAAVRHLGKGAQAHVYLAYDHREDRWVAAKVLSRKMLGNDDVRRRFLNEARTMQRLAHPHVLPVLDMGDDGPVPWLILELCRGGSLTSWMRRNGPLPAGLAVDVALQAADALHHAHTLGVVHRDVKPHNLLVRGPGQVAVTDFGVAQVADASMTATGTVMGTFAFMAPEQRDDAKSVDARADIYSLSVSLFGMIAGRPSGELFYAEPDDPMMERVPPPLRPVLIRAAAYRRDDRPPTMQAFADTLQALRPQLQGPLPALDDAWLRLPDKVPSVLSPADVESLRDELALDEHHPTYIPSTSAAMARLEADQTVYETEREDDDDAPTVRMGLPVLDLTPPPAPAVVLTPPTPAPAPHQPTPAPAPRATPPAAPRSWLKPGLAVAAGFLAATTVWLAAVGLNVLLAFSIDAATTRLADSMPSAESAMVPLDAMGADIGPLQALYGRWEQSGAPEDAVAFAAALERTADHVGADDMARSRMVPLTRAATDYASVRRQLEARRDSLLAWLSLGIGLPEDDAGEASP